MPAEDVIFYFDLGVRGVVSKKAIVKQVQSFIKAKEKKQPGSNWGIVAFQHGEDNPHFHEGLAKDEEGLEPFLKDNLKFSTKAHPLEQGLMLASTYLVDAYRTTRNHALRMIVISDGPTEESNAYLVDALLDLLDTIKHFPVYIDIIRVGDERVYPDDIKLKTIAEAANGQVHYAATDDAFKDIMEKLFEKAPTVGKTGPISIEKRTYFENLCWSLLEKDVHGLICIACAQGEQAGTVLQCENCGTPYHLSCASSISQREYEAFSGIFRCKKCDCLLNTASRKIIIPTSQAPKKPVQQVKAEPVRITIKVGGDAVPAMAQAPVKPPEPAAAPLAEKPLQPAVTFTVKAIQQPGQGQLATSKPAAQSMKPPAAALSMKPPATVLSAKPPVAALSMTPPAVATTRPSPVKPRDECDEDIKVISLDECKPTANGGEIGSEPVDNIVIVDEKASGKPTSFWKKGKA